MPVGTVVGSYTISGRDPPAVAPARNRRNAVAGSGYHPHSETIASREMNRIHTYTIDNGHGACLTFKGM